MRRSQPGRLDALPFAGESDAMPLEVARTNADKLADNAEHHRTEMLRAARTVRISVSDPAAQEELLECLGLLDLQGS